MPTGLHRAARRLTAGLGAHDYGLLLIGVVWTLMGVGVLTGPQTGGGGSSLLLHQYLPVPIRATLWLTGALLCIAAAVDHRRRRGLGEAVALSVACIAPTLRVASHGWAWVASLIPGEPDGSARGWLAAGIYGSMLGLVLLVASIKEPPPEPHD